MRKTISFAGVLLIAVLLFAKPSKADSVIQYEVIGHSIDVTFTLPQTSTPSNVLPNGILQFQNITGTIFTGIAYDFLTIQIGNSGINNFANYWDFGSQTRSFGIYVPGLYTKNADGTYTLNPGTFAIGDFHIFTGGPFDYRLTATLVDIPPVGTPEPASLILLGVGGLLAAGLRRRKTA
jgi:hypothetical protein